MRRVRRSAWRGSAAPTQRRSTSFNSTQNSVHPRDGATWPACLTVLYVCLVVANGECPSSCLCLSELAAQCQGTGDDLRPTTSALDANLEDLEVTGGGIRTVKRAVFRPLPRLRRIVLDFNSISAVEDGAFVGLLALRELSLVSNLVEHLPSRVLDHSVALDRFFLSGNQLVLPEDEPFLWSPSLRWLQLDGCGLLHLPERVFQGLPNLRVLQLRENGLESLGNAVLSLARLSVLALQGNRLVRQVFHLPPSLDLLNLNDNDISALEKGMFDETINLEYLMVANNYITAVHAGSLLPLQKLKFFDAEGNKLNGSFKVLSSSASIELANLQNLSSLKLQGNNMDVLNLEVFVKMKSLRELSLSRNEIKTVTNGYWDEMHLFDHEEKPKLEILSLSENKIDFLGTSLRSYMGSLLNLNLSSNRLASFSSSRLTQETPCGLKVLDLSHNRINPSYAKTLDLDFLPNLEYLSLLRNNIENMNDNTFRRLKRLKHLDLSVNKFKSLPENIFRNLKELRVLYLKFLNMNDGVDNWQPKLFDSLINLEVLSLQGNNIRNIPKTLFNKLKHLRQLDLSYNNLNVLDLDSLGNCGNLRYLNLQYNRLAYYRCDVPCTLASTTNLNLEGNSLKTIPQSISTTFPSLQRLDMSKNLLQSLDFQALESLENLSSVRVSYNPVQCDCAVRASWERYGGVSDQSVEATCQEPGVGSARPWSAAGTLRCGGPAVTALTAGVVVLVLLVATNALLGAALLCGRGRRGARGRSECPCAASADALLPCAHSRRARDSDDTDNEKNSRVERWRGVALYYGTDSEGEEEDPARAGLAYNYDALLWAAGRRAQSRSDMYLHTVPL